MALERSQGLRPFSAKRLAQFEALGIRPASTLDKPSKDRTDRPRATDTGPDKAVADAVLSRDEWHCASCGDELYGRRGIEYSLHHRKRRSQGGDNRPSNLVALCGHGTSGCHGAVHSEIARARLVGLLLRSDEDPEELAVEHAIHGRVRLTDDAKTVPAPEEEASDV